MIKKKKERKNQPSATRVRQKKTLHDQWIKSVTSNSHVTPEKIGNLINESNGKEFYIFSFSLLSVTRVDAVAQTLRDISYELLH